MYFTNAQVKAIWVVLVVLVAALGYRYYEVLSTQPDTAELRRFEENFRVVRDSLLREYEKADTVQVIRPKHFPININTASFQELQLLPRVGPALAQRILDYRQANGPFKTKSGIMAVKGIGPKSYQKIQPLIVIK